MRLYSFAFQFFLQFKCKRCLINCVEYESVVDRQKLFCYDFDCFLSCDAYKENFTQIKIGLAICFRYYSYTRIQLESYHIISRICKIAYTISYNLLTDHTDFFTEFILELRVYLDYLLFFRLQVFTSKRFIVKH